MQCSNSEHCTAKSLIIPHDYISISFMGLYGALMPTINSGRFLSVKNPCPFMPFPLRDKARQIYELLLTAQSLQKKVELETSSNDQCSFRESLSMMGLSTKHIKCAREYQSLHFRKIERPC